MSAEISVSQAKMCEYHNLISEGKGIKLGVYTRTAPYHQSAPKMLARYLFIKLGNGVYLTQDEFDHFPPHKIEQIKKLAQMTFDANRISDSEEQAKRGAFVSFSCASHLTYVTSSEEEELTKPLRRTQLGSVHRRIHSDVKQASINLMRIFKCSTKEEVNALDNTSFPKIYTHFSRMSPEHAHDIIFKISLKHYTEQSLDRYLYPLLSTNASQELMAIIKQKVGNDDLDLENKEHITAVFQSIEAHGNHHLTTEHSFLTLNDIVAELCHKLFSHAKDPTAGPSPIDHLSTQEKIPEVGSSTMTSEDGTRIRGLSRTESRANWQFALSQIKNFNMGSDGVPSACTLQEDLNCVEKSVFYQSLIHLIEEKKPEMNDVQKFALRQIMCFIQDNDESISPDEAVLGIALVQILRHEAQEERPLSRASSSGFLDDESDQAPICQHGAGGNTKAKSLIDTMLSFIALDAFEHAAQKRPVFTSF